MGIYFPRVRDYKMVIYSWYCCLTSWNKNYRQVDRCVNTIATLNLLYWCVNFRWQIVGNITENNSFLVNTYIIIWWTKYLWYVGNLLKKTILLPLSTCTYLYLSNFILLKSVWENCHHINHSFSKFCKYQCLPTR